VGGASVVGVVPGLTSPSVLAASGDAGGTAAAKNPPSNANIRNAIQTPPEGPVVTQDFEAILPFWRIRAARAGPDVEAGLARTRVLLQAGMVAINEYPVTFPQTPFLGWKQSGLGLEQGVDAVLFYTHVKNVLVNLE